MKEGMERAMERQRMVEEQIAVRGVTDPATLASMQEVPRHLFVPEEMSDYAYSDCPLTIGEGQTISQPYIVALMTQAARPNPEAKVLDIGTGSGYAAAVFSRIVKDVYTIERISSLSERAQEVFQRLGYENIHAKVGDGTQGWPEEGPYDAIVVTAGAPVVPKALIAQLKEGGKLVIPVGDFMRQQLMCITKDSVNGDIQELIELVRFVPLIGEEGWKEE